MTESAPLVRVIRSGLEESVHLGHVAVCDRDGQLVAHAGEPARPLYSRSAMKPLQAAVSMSAMSPKDLDGRDRLSDAQVAVMCASHNGEDVHVETVRSVLARGGLGVEALGCPPDWPIDQEAMAHAGERRRELHNCSGKHAGKLLSCARAGWDVASYLDPSHPLQQRILAAVESGTGIESPRIGVDGCGSPVHGVTVAAMATLYARLGEAGRWEGLSPHVDRAVKAMLAQPYLVAGRDRVDTAVMEVGDGVVVKAGAEGLICSSIPAGGLGIAIKVADGSARAAGPALIEVLRQLDLIDQTQVERLAAHARPPVLGGGSPVGELEPLVELRRTDP
jgi:L-asparaginase II